MAATYLYIYRNDTRREVYIGIGEHMSRIWQQHNQRASDLLNAQETEVLVTATPFSSRREAEKAEAAAICAAAAAGATVLSDNSEHTALTNIAKATQSSHLVPAVYTRPTDALPVRFSTLEKTAVIVVRIDQLENDERPTLHGGRDAEIFADRARRWWPLGAAERRHRRAQEPGKPPIQTVTQLVMAQKGTGTILGAWTLKPEQWQPAGPSWEFLLNKPIEDWRGRRLDFEGYHPSNGVTWSNDISPKSPRVAR